MDYRTGAEMPTVVEQTMSDLALTRSTGVPFMARLMGVQSVPSGSARFALRFDPRRAALSAGVGMLDVAMLADLALGGALRTQVGSDRRMPTITLTLQLDAPVTHTDVSVRAWDSEVAHGVGGARGELVSNGKVNGRCLATFVVPEAGAESTAMPWEDGAAGREASVMDAAELTPAERDVVTSVGELARAGTRDGQSWTEALVAEACSAAATHPAGLRLRPTVAMVNRAGRVQGAVLFGLAWAAAVKSVGPASVRTLSGHMEFVASADPHTPIAADPVLMRATRQMFFVRSELRQDGRLVAAASFVFQRHP